MNQWDAVREKNVIMKSLKQFDSAAAYSSALQTYSLSVDQVKN